MDVQPSYRRYLDVISQYKTVPEWRVCYSAANPLLTQYYHFPCLCFSTRVQYLTDKFCTSIYLPLQLQDQFLFAKALPLCLNHLCLLSVRPQNLLVWDSPPSSFPLQAYDFFTLRHYRSIQPWLKKQGGVATVGKRSRTMRFGHLKVQGRTFTKCASLAAQSTEMCVYHMPRWAKEYYHVSGPD